MRAPHGADLAGPILAVILAAGAGALGAGAQPGGPAAAPAPRDLRDEVFYHFMPIAWRDSAADSDAEDPHRFGDFTGMIESLDYLSWLGVTAVWMNPVFPSRAYHGYQHGPADRVNPWLGTEAQFLGFVDAAHARGMRVFLDVVCYGISTDTDWFRDALRNPASRYDAWLAFTDEGNTRWQGYEFTTWTGERIGFIHWDLNHPGPRALVTGWCARWLDPNGDGDPGDGVDGYRLDHVWARYAPTPAPPARFAGADPWGYSVEGFWVPWKASLRAVNPRVTTFAEQARWETTGADLLAAHDAALAKPVQAAARASLRARSREPLLTAVEDALASLRGVPPGRTYLGTVGDHDVDRIASVVDGDPRRAALAAVLLMTLPFPPVIYMGDEIGMLGEKADVGSDANDIPLREPFKWNAVAGPPMTDYWAADRSAGRRRHSADRDGRSVEEQRGVPGSLLETCRTLIALRTEHGALRRGDFQRLDAGDARVVAYARRAEGSGVAVALNLGDGALVVGVDVPHATGESLSGPARILSGGTLRGATPGPAGTRLVIELPPHGYAVVALP